MLVNSFRTYARSVNYEMAISDTPDRTYVLERDCGVCVWKGRDYDTLRLSRANRCAETTRVVAAT